MAEAVLMPRQGQSVESCIIGEWHKKKGDDVKVGDKLFTYETDKATFDEEAQVAGTLIAVFFGEGDDVPVLKNVCVIGKEGDDWSAFVPAGATQDGAGAAAAETPPATTPEPDVQAAAATAVETKVTPTAQPTPAVGISPRARGLAERTGVDARQAGATGPEGRVIERDVTRLLKEGPAPQELIPVVTAVTVTEAQELAYRDEKLPQIRKLIAKAMHDSLSTMAQLTINRSFDASDLLQLRERIKAASASGRLESLGLSLLEKTPTINDLVLFAVSRVARRHPYANAHYLDDYMRFFEHVQLGVAVDTPRGLMVPVVRDADTLTVGQIGAEVRRLAADAQSGTINPDYLKGGTITVTNLGSLGVESFTPVINPPETCILGVNTIQTAVRERAGVLEAYPSMTLSLTHDHRAWDGAPAARFLADVCLALENISLLLMSGN